MSTGGAVASTISHDRSWRQFVRHFLEMVAAMIVAMAVLGAVIRLILLPLLGFSYAELADLTELRALVMATNMVIGMSLWMRHRGHGWTSIWEMAAAMYLPFIVLFGPFWAGLLSGRAVVGLGHVLMLSFMVVAMLHRRDEYAQDHRRAHARPCHECRRAGGAYGHLTELPARDQRELALRDILYRDVLGGRPRRPTQRQPPPEAPAGDQPATPRRSDPEHPPLGAPLNPRERFQRGERIRRWQRSVLLRTTT